MKRAILLSAGLMLLTGQLDSEQITRTAAITDELNDEWYWYVIWAVAAGTGLVTQIVSGERRAADMRAAWAQA